MKIFCKSCAVRFIEDINILIILKLNQIDLNCLRKTSLAVVYRCYYSAWVKRRLFASFLSDFKMNVRAAPIRSVDVYNLMCWTLGVDPLPNNGSWSRVECLLSSSDGVSHPFWIYCVGLLAIILTT